MKKKVLILLAIFICLIGSYFLWRYRIFHPSSSKFPIIAAAPLKERAEEKLLQSLYAPDALAKACSLNMLGNDENYVYAYGRCEEIFKDDEGVIALSSLVAGPVRFSYKGANFVLTSSEYTTFVCPTCGGTKPEDILPPVFYTEYRSIISDEEDRLLEKENIQKMLTGRLITKEIAIFLTKESAKSYDDFGLRGDVQLWPSWKSDAIGNEKDGWDVALYMYVSSWSGTGGAKESGAVFCYHVATDMTVIKTKEYIPKNLEVLQDIDPKTCMPYSSTH